MNLIVDDLLINYELMGKGKAVLLLHGWGDSARTFKALAQDLSKSYLIISLDLPGFGHSEAPKTVWNLDNYAVFLDHFLSKLAIQPYAVIGHSNGGALAIRAIAISKLKASKLVLLAASGIRNKHGLKRIGLKIVAKTGKAATLWLPSGYRQRLRQRLYGTIGSDLLVVPSLQETFKQTVRQDVQADAAKLSIPTLLIFADQDPAIPLADGRTYNQLIKKSDLKIMHSANHFVHHDQPEQVLTLIKEFL